MCDCDNMPEFCTITNPIARKPHKCCECGETIAVGERYDSCRGKWDSGVQTMRTCLACVELRDSLAALDDGCFCFGELADAVAKCRALPAGVAEFTARLEASRKDYKTCGSCS